jgi:prolyl-tRNA synthetase
MGTSHLLGQNFAKPFSVKFADRENVEQYAWQTSWGVSWRLIGALIMVHGDDKGLVLPPRMAPIQVVIVPVHSVQGDDVWQAATDLAERLRQKGCRAHVDDRQNVTTGYKYGDWELRGVPLRVEMGPRDLKDGAAVLVRRDTGDKGQSGLAGIEDTVAGMLDTIQSDMLESARRRAAGMSSTAQDYESLVSLISDGGFVRAGWCGNEKCEERIKEETGADIRLVDEDGSGPCIVCGSPSVHGALFARGY